MNKPAAKIIILGATFLAAVIIIFLLSGRTDKKEVSYTILGESALPVVHLYAQDVRVDPLRGFTAEVNAGEQMESLIPLGEDMKIPFLIETAGSNVTGIAFEVRSIDGADLIERASLESWIMEGGTNPKGEIRIKDIIEEGRQYRLVIKLSTERQSDISYYLRVVRSPGIKTAEMLEYVTDFHRSEFDTEDISKYAVNWEPDNSADNSTLARVNIHSSFRSLSYRDLQVIEVGEPQITILEMDESFGSFRVDCILKARNENDGTDYYNVSEFFCLQWTQQRFYLMKYERTMTQSFSAGRGAITSEAVNFGITAPEDVQTMVSPDGTALAFVVCGELWCHDREAGTLAEIYSMTEKTSSAGKLRRDYGIRVVSVGDDGSVDFFVYGYMNRGRHEGGNGLAYYRYDPESGALSEPLYIPTIHGFGLISTWIDTICENINGTVYFLFDDTLYSMDPGGAELVRMVEDASGHGLLVNETGDTLAWSAGVGDEPDAQIRIRCLDEDTSATISAPEGMYLMIEGFIDRDLVYTAGRPEDEGTFALEPVKPRLSLSVTDTSGSEIARYEKQGVVITSVTVGEGKLTLERMRAAEGSYIIIEDEVLMQSDRQLQKEKEVLTSEVLEKRLKVWSYPWESDGNADMVVPGVISHGEGTAAYPEAEDINRFFAFACGELSGVYESAGEAINSVYDDMGFVTDSRGYRVWNRTAKQVGRANAKLPPELTAGMGGEELAALLDPELTVSLKDCNINSIMRFTAKSSPVIFTDGEGTAQIITGCDRYSIWLWDRESGESVKTTIEAADELIEAGDRRIISVIRR